MNLLTSPTPREIEEDNKSFWTSQLMRNLSNAVPWFSELDEQSQQRLAEKTYETVLDYIKNPWKLEKEGNQELIEVLWP